MYKVDYDTLAGLAEELRAVRDTFHDLEDDTDGHEGILGSGEVAGGLADFGSNWSVKRQQIALNLKDVFEAADEAAKRYEQADGDIAAAFAS